MILLVALTCASLWLIIAAPPRAVARLRSATVRQGGYRTGAKSSRQAAGKIVARARGPRTAPAAQTEVDIAILLDLIAVEIGRASCREMHEEEGVGVARLKPTRLVQYEAEQDSQARVVDEA